MYTKTPECVLLLHRKIQMKLEWAGKILSKLNLPEYPSPLIYRLAFALRMFVGGVRKSCCLKLGAECLTIPFNVAVPMYIFVDTHYNIQIFQRRFLIWAVDVNGASDGVSGTLQKLNRFSCCCHCYCCCCLYNGNSILILLNASSSVWCQLAYQNTLMCVCVCFLRRESKFSLHISCSIFWKVSYLASFSLFVAKILRFSLTLSHMPINLMLSEMCKKEN